MLKRLVVSVAGLMVALAVIAPAPAFARMHFTTTNERLSALAQRAQSSLALTAPAEIQTQLNEIINQAQAAKAAAEEAAGRPASNNAEDKSVLAMVAQEMDAIVASANRARNASGQDQRAALQDIQTRSDNALKTLQARIAAQQAAAPAASPSVLPNSGQVAGVGAAPSLWLVGLAFLTGGVGLLAVTRGRRLF